MLAVSGMAKDLLATGRKVAIFLGGFVKRRYQRSYTGSLRVSWPIAFHIWASFMLMDGVLGFSGLRQMWMAFSASPWQVGLSGE